MTVTLPYRGELRFRDVVAWPSCPPRDGRIRVGT